MSISSSTTELLDEIVSLLVPQLKDQAQAGSLMMSVERALMGGINVKLFEMRLIGDEFFRHLRGDDYAKAKKLETAYYETLANRGDATAMRYTACAYANGHHSFVANVTRNAAGEETGHTFSSMPDLKTAFLWASKAAAAGDVLSRDKILPSIKAEIASKP